MKGWPYLLTCSSKVCHCIKPEFHFRNFRNLYYFPGWLFFKTGIFQKFLIAFIKTSLYRNLSFAYTKWQFELVSLKCIIQIKYQNSILCWIVSKLTISVASFCLQCVLIILKEQVSSTYRHWWTSSLFLLFSDK